MRCSTRSGTCDQCGLLGESVTLEVQQEPRGERDNASYEASASRVRRPVWPRAVGAPDPVGCACPHSLFLLGRSFLIGLLRLRPSPWLPVLRVANGYRLGRARHCHATGGFHSGAPLLGLCLFLHYRGPSHEMAPTHSVGSCRTSRHSGLRRNEGRHSLRGLVREPHRALRYRRGRGAVAAGVLPRLIAPGQRLTRPLALIGVVLVIIVLVFAGAVILLQGPVLPDIAPF